MAEIYRLIENARMEEAVEGRVWYFWGERE
jgi:hypothetical protein